MSIFDITDKALFQSIKTVTAARATNNLRLHVLACQCVWRAATPAGGRVEALQMLHDNLRPLERDALRAWLGPKANTFAVNLAKQWLSFRDNKFAIVGGTVENRPTRDAIEKIAADVERFFLNKRAGEVAVQLNWDDELAKQVTNLIGRMVKNDAIPAGLRQDAEAFKSNVLAFVAKRKSTVETKSDVPAVTGNALPVVETKPKVKAPAKAKTVARDLKALGDAIADVTKVPAAA